MEQAAVRLRRGDVWTYLGGKADAKKPVELVVRAFDGDGLAAVGDSDEAPTGAPVRVPAGEGRRLVGRCFFAKPAAPDGDLLITIRGL